MCVCVCVSSPQSFSCPLISIICSCCCCCFFQNYFLHSLSFACSACARNRSSTLHSKPATYAGNTSHPGLAQIIEQFAFTISGGPWKPPRKKMYGFYKYTEWAGSNRKVHHIDIREKTGIRLRQFVALREKHKTGFVAPALYSSLTTQGTKTLRSARNVLQLVAWGLLYYFKFSNICTL